MLHGGSAITYDTYILSYLTCCIYCVLNVSSVYPSCYANSLSFILYNTPKRPFLDCVELLKYFHKYLWIQNGILNMPFYDQKTTTNVCQIDKLHVSSLLNMVLIYILWKISIKKKIKKRRFKFAFMNNICASSYIYIYIYRGMNKPESRITCSPHIKVIYKSLQI